MSKSFVVVYEAQADFTTATELADRVLVAEVEWLDDTLLDSQRQWIAEDGTGSPLTWKSIPTRARRRGIRVRGHFDGNPGLPDARAARRAIAYVRDFLDAFDAILLIRDRDDQPERRQGLEQARTDTSLSDKIVIGFAVIERESWVLSGFDPESDDEDVRLTAEMQALGFDPRRRPEQLTARKNDAAAKRSPKRVLAALTADDWDRQRRCWLDTSLEVLEKRGKGNGPKAYLGEVRSRLVRLITGKKREPEQP